MGSRRKTPPDAEIAALWLGSNSLTEVGNELGVTREFVRQCRNRTLPAWLISLHEQRIAARTRLAAYVRDGEARTLRDCIVCGRAFSVRADVAHPRGSCSPEHRRIWYILRVHLPGEREARPIRNARRTLAVTENPVKRRHAQRVLDGTAESRGSWLQVGSEAHAMATRAAVNGWPIFDRLPAQIQAQIREAA